MRIADPKPGFCSKCYGAHPERRYVDCQADFDGAPVLDRDTGTIAILPWTHDLGTHDSLYLCEVCVREMMEVLALKPEVQARQFDEIRRVRVERDHWRETARRLKNELDAQLDAGLGEAPIRRRRVAA